MTYEDLAWVQGQLRGCANARRQLRICAECLCLTEDELLTHLGYKNMAAFRAAHPQSKHPVGPQVERIYHPALLRRGTTKQRVQPDGLHPAGNARGHPAQGLHLEKEAPGACRRYAAQAAQYTHKGENYGTEH